MATLTISDAARRCGVTRRTLQRAIHAGRLELTSDHRLTLEALRQGGYVPATTTPHAPQRPSHGTTHGTRQRQSQALAPVVARLNRVIELLETLCHTLESQYNAATPPWRDPATHRSDTPQRQGPGSTPGPQEMTQPSPYDPTRYVLGTLCQRGHAYGDTGQSLRKRTNGACVACERAQQRQRRARKREEAQDG